MNVTHKNKTLATFLASIFGSIGAHRFYLYGKKDKWAWIHVALFPLSIFAGFIAALVIGLTPDEKWDAQHNAHSGRQSNSGWLVIILVVITFAGGAIALIAAIARAFDLFFTGGAYG
jgi:TM2 domain-containing membrane protein YozV